MSGGRPEENHQRGKREKSMPCRENKCLSEDSTFSTILMDIVVLEVLCTDPFGVQMDKRKFGKVFKFASF